MVILLFSAENKTLIIYYFFFMIYDNRVRREHCKFCVFIKMIIDYFFFFIVQIITVIEKCYRLKSVSARIYEHFFSLFHIKTARGRRCDFVQFCKTFSKCILKYCLLQTYWKLYIRFKTILASDRVGRGRGRAESAFICP